MMITAMINNIISTPYTYQSGNVSAIDLFWAFKTFFFFVFILRSENLEIRFKSKMRLYRHYKFLLPSRITIVLYLTFTAVVLKVNELNLPFVSSTYIILFDYYQRSFRVLKSIHVRTYVFQFIFSKKIDNILYYIVLKQI